MKNNVFKNENGQVILIVLIISALIMTIGLSLSRKAVVETKIDSDEEMLKQAFNTAESGIDYYLGTGRTDYVAPDGMKKADVMVSQIGSSANFLDFSEYYVENNPSMFWLVGHDALGDIDYANKYNYQTVDICVSNGFRGSLKVDYYYRDIGLNYGVNRQGYNFGSVPNIVNGFIDVSGTADNSCGTGKKALNFDLGAGNTPLLISLTPIWQGTRISLRGTAADAQFPSQGTEISAVGRAGDVKNGVNRKVTVQNRYKIPQFLFDAITAGNSITNN